MKSNYPALHNISYHLNIIDHLKLAGLGVEGERVEEHRTNERDVGRLAANVQFFKNKFNNFNNLGRLAANIDFIKEILTIFNNLGRLAANIQFIKNNLNHF